MKFEENNKSYIDSEKVNLQAVLQLKYTQILSLGETWALHYS